MGIYHISRKHFVFSRVITICFAELMTGSSCHSRLSHALRGPLSMTFRYISRKHFVFSRVITVCFAELMTSSVCKISPKFYILPTASYSVIIGWRIARIITPTINASIRIINGSKTAIICSVAVVTSSS